MKTTTEAERKIDTAITEAIELGQLGGHHAAAYQIAASIYDAEPGLMRELQREWMIERLTWMIGRRRRVLWSSAVPEQLMLPDPVFQNLPKTIILSAGRRPRLDRCTLKEISEHLESLRGRFPNHPRVIQMEAVANLMRKHAQGKRNMTWEEAKEREAKDRELRTFTE